MITTSIASSSFDRGMGPTNVPKIVAHRHQSHDSSSQQAMTTTISMELAFTYGPVSHLLNEPQAALD